MLPGKITDFSDTIPITRTNGIECWQRAFLLTTDMLELNIFT